MNFVITDVDEVNGIITVFGEDESLVCEVYLDDVFNKHPGATGYTADRDCDRADDYHIEPYDLLDNGSDEGELVNMVAYVWNDVPKKWLNEDSEEIIFPSNHSEMRWISVNDRIPTEDGRYIVRTKYTYRNSKKTFYGEGIGYLHSFPNSFSNDEVKSAEITHWMEMPVVPENMGS